MRENQPQQQAEEPERIAIETGPGRYMIAREATADDLDGDLIERNGKLYVIVKTLRL